MDVFIPDTTTPSGTLLAEDLSRRGHKVLSCRRLGQASSCAVLDGRSCPLERSTADVALAVGRERRRFERGDGATCAVTHRVPLVLVSPDPQDPLVEHAASTATFAEAVDKAEAVAASPLRIHTGIAQGVVEQELNRIGASRSALSVEVRRRSGSLSVELVYPGELERETVERIATHVVQAVREHDHFAIGVDVSLVRQPTGGGGVSSPVVSVAPGVENMSADGSCVAV